MAVVHIEGSTAIGRSVDDVYAFVASPRNLTEWVGPIVEVEGSSPAVAPPVGSTFTIVQKFLGRRLISPCEVTEQQPDRRFGYRTTGGPIPLNFILVLEGEGPATRVTYTAEGEPGTFFSLVGPLFERAAKRQLSNDLETLKDLLESQAVAP